MLSKRNLILAAALVLVANAVPAAERVDGAILSRQVHPIPAWAELAKKLRSVGEPQYARIRDDARFRLERITYASDGLAVTGYVYGPAKAPGIRLPAIIVNRGGYVAEALELESLVTFHRFAESGYVVLAPMYRESDGGEGADKVGGDDVHDVANLIAVARNLGTIDLARVFMFGESRGGMMALLALRGGMPVRAAATVGAFTDLQTLIEAKPETYKPLIPKIWPDYDTAGDAVRERRSARMWAGEINTPLLILHGGNDQSVDPQHALALATAMQKAGKPYELHIVAGGNHTLTSQREERDRAVLAWFALYVK
jgi:dipeptidyl aminopeptidase/acylaminoacyl peptidase